jgi:2',3'-cyclic-nucleotide 2'-phosphodiesterase (5'-nucleotidase family)
MRIHNSSFLLLVLLMAACSPALYQPASKVTYGKYDVKPGTGVSSMQTMLAPYSANVNTTMNTVIGSLAQPLEKKMPESSLGFFMTDSYKYQAEKVFGQKVDLAFMNNGGIRINNMPAGKITVGSIYELMPFDNLLVLLELNGNQLQALMDHIATRGGWPISGGTYKVVNKKAMDVMVNNSALSPNGKYVIAISDYIANGGDDCVMLKNIPQLNKGYLQRDALIDYVKAKCANGQPLTLPVMNRVQSQEAP